MVVIEGSTLIALYIALGSLTVINKIISIMRHKGIFDSIYERLNFSKKQIEASIKSSKRINVDGVDYLKVDNKTIDSFNISEDIIDLIRITKI